MTDKRMHFHNGEKGVALTIRVIPRASKNEIVDILPDGTIKIRINAPPVDGKANETLVRFLAELFNIHYSRVEIVGGLTGRNKLVSITGLENKYVDNILTGIVKK